MSDVDGRPTARNNPSAAKPPTPRWVKVSGVIALVFVVVFLILHLTGNGMAGMHG